MSKILIVVIVLISLNYLLTKTIKAETSISESSAKLKSTTVSKNFDHRQVILKKFLKSHNSPLAYHAQILVKAADEYNLDWRLITAISGVESTFGRKTPLNSYNAYGWANGKYYFSSWEESIYYVSRELREKYIDRGANNIGKIARIYAPPSKTWAWKVRYFMNKIEPLPVEFAL